MKYPTRSGLIISPYEFYGVPTELQYNTRRVTNNHHGYFERQRYNDVRVRSIFRNLVTNVYPLLTRDHRELHEEYSAPPVPKDSLMIDVIDQYAFEHGQIDMVVEKRTRETHSMSIGQWDLIKGGFREQIIAARSGGLTQFTNLGIS